ncbi:MAG: DUF2252 domain-containing protein [Myxococcales bacterium]
MALEHQHNLSVANRRELGRAAREHAPRSSHADWEPSPKRADPVSIVCDADADRVELLVPIRHDRMSVSTLAFYRGTAAIMAADLARTPNSGLEAQLCGDAHLSNFGLYASPERSLLFDVNDFDETHPGPWEWDLKRLAASLVIAARHNSFSAAAAREASLTAVRSYRESMRDYAGMAWLDIWYQRIDAEQILSLAADHDQLGRIDKAIEKARRRTSHQVLMKLTEEVDGERRIISKPPLIVPLRDAPEFSEEGALEERVQELLERYRGTLTSDRRHLLERYEVVDIAHKIVGVGSVGRRCFIVFLKGRDWGDPLILQLKEAAKHSVLTTHGGLRPCKVSHGGRRVVQGQRLMQAASDVFLGWNETHEGRDFYWRQLRDMKGSLEVETWRPTDLVSYAQVCGWALARAHARSGDPVAIAGYLGKSDTFDRALAVFAERYADQADKDYVAYREAIQEQRVSTEPALHATVRL